MRREDRAREEVEPPRHLIHLTRTVERLDAILREGTVRALNPFGAITGFPPLRDSQLATCFSAIDFDQLPELASRHGHFGLGLDGRWMVARSARPVAYLPYDTTTQQAFFELVKRSAYSRSFDPDNDLWLETPFIEYPSDSKSRSGWTRGDWRWEREWRVRGALTIDEPKHVGFLVAPEGLHEGYRQMWDHELGQQGRLGCPPIVDIRWPASTKLAAIEEGRDKTAAERKVSFDHGLSTHSPPLSWRGDSEVTQNELIAEWVIWLDDMASEEI